MTKTFPGYTTITNLLGQSLYVPTKTYDLVLRLLEQGSNVFLFGEAGTAKTELADAIFRTELGISFYQMEFGAISSGDQLDGERSLNEKKELINIDSPLLKAIKQASSGARTGLIEDELNRVQAAGALNKLLTLHGSQRMYTSDLGGQYHVGQELVTVATANIGYFGTVRINEALLDRYDAVGTHPIGGQVLTAVLEERFPRLPLKELTPIVSFADQVRKEANKDPDSDLKPITTRDVLKICRGMQAGLKPIESISELVGGALQIQQRPRESVDALVTVAKGKFAA